MEKVSLQEILMNLLRLLIVFAMGTSILIIVLCVFFGNTNVFNYIFSTKSSAGVIKLIIVTYIYGILIGILMSAVTCICTISEKKQELAECEKENQLLKEKLNKKKPVDPKQKIFNEIENFGCSSVQSEDFNKRTEQDN